MIAEILSKHPVLEKISQKIAKVTPVDGSLEQIEISGVPFSLQSNIMRVLSGKTSKGIFAATRDDSEIRSYLRTVTVIDLKKIHRADLLVALVNNGFIRVPKVLEKGEYSITGDVVSFWPLGYPHPARVSFFDEAFESAGLFDEIYGKKEIDVSYVFIGDLNELETDIFHENLVIVNPDQEPAPVVLVFGGDALDSFESRSDFVFDFTYPELFFQRFDLLRNSMENYLKKDYRIYVGSEHKDILPREVLKNARMIKTSLDAGFISNELKTILLTDRELFGTIFLNKAAKKLNAKKARQILAELEGEIEIGDFVVHEAHGVGIYKGLKQEKVEQIVNLGFGEFKTSVYFEDYILIEYKDKDELYVPLSQINKITKYIGMEGSEPKLTSLGRMEWQNYTKRIKASVAKYAKDLVELYAKRELAKAPAIDIEYSKDYIKFVEEFPYEETPDQKRTEKEVMKDLAETRPMNRLIVGDVGFGKTEIAIRAAFRMAEAGFQVAMLCPTTVLASQHEKVFIDRFKGTDFKVACLSRLNKKSVSSNLKRITSGEVNVIIGTHRLLSSDLIFKKLGLIIIDEEQKFGVKQKEYLKKLELGVHVLAMSATPIPRSLSMALANIQDISIIETPPVNRKAIKNFLMKMNWQKICDAIMKETARHGQVYYVHNRVQTIQSVYSRLTKLLPGVRFVIAHGQMAGDDLSKVMADFYDKKYDCLICTTIIENGLDMPNVNTIIIEQAQNFGLGQLYQLRGRVGRSDKEAFAYLFYEGNDMNDPIEDEDDEVSGEKKLKQKNYMKRLKAFAEASDLGSGFKLASRDLEIRGAGNMLGREQHGYISQIGYGLYMQLLAEEIERLKNS